MGLASTLIERLTPLVAWLERINSAPFLKQQLLSQIRAGVFPWEPAAFLHSVAFAHLDGPPSLLLAPAFTDITILHWRFKVRPNSLAPNQTLNARSDTADQYVMWWKACRRVEKWSTREPGLTYSNRQHRGEGSSAIAAQLQATFRASRELKALASSRIAPPVPIVRHWRDSAGVGSLAYFLGWWATAIWKAFLRQPVNPLNWSPPFIVDEPGGTQRGWVLFPTVPNLSIALIDTQKGQQSLPTDHLVGLSKN